MSPHAYIYVAGPDERGCVKIGITGDLSRRMIGIWNGKGLPRWTTFWGPFKRGDAYKVEKLAQTSLDQQAAGREWFYVERETAVGAVEKAAKRRRLDLGEPMQHQNGAAKLQDSAAETARFYEWWAKIESGEETEAPADRPEWQKYVDRERGHDGSSD